MIELRCLIILNYRIYPRTRGELDHSSPRGGWSRRVRSLFCKFAGLCTPVFLRPQPELDHAADRVAHLQTCDPLVRGCPLSIDSSCGNSPDLTVVGNARQRLM